MLQDLMSPAGLISIAFASVLVSLIPAVVLKVLMGAIFSTPVSYLMVLVGLAVSGFLAVFAAGVFAFFGGSRLEEMAGFEALIWMIGGFVVQAWCLKVIATGPRMVMISVWKWCAVLVLQYVVYAVIGLIYIFVAG